LSFCKLLLLLNKSLLLVTLVNNSKQNIVVTILCVGYFCYWLCYSRCHTNQQTMTSLSHPLLCEPTTINYLSITVLTTSRPNPNTNLYDNYSSAKQIPKTRNTHFIIRSDLNPYFKLYYLIQV